MITTAEEFIRLRRSEIPNEYKRAGCEEAPYEVWMEIIENHPKMRIWVARNRTITTELQTILAKDKDFLVRYAIASKYPIDRSLYEILSKDQEESVRLRIITNKKTPLDILKTMANEDREEFIKEKAIAKYRERVEKESLGTRT